MKHFFQKLSGWLGNEWLQFFALLMAVVLVGMSITADKKSSMMLSAFYWLMVALFLGYIFWCLLKVGRTKAKDHDVTLRD